MISAADPAGIEERIGYRFKDRRLLLAALTHRSYLNEADDPDAEDNERLEFLGDAVVGHVAGEILFLGLPDATEGQLTAMRAALVCEPTLARLATDVDLGPYLRLGKGEAVTGGRDRSGLLCDAFEALVGALYLDGGMGPVFDFVEPLFRSEIEQLGSRRELKDAKSRLQELAQSRWQLTPKYRTVDESGPDHAKEFVVEAVIGGEAYGQGRGRSKSAAARKAAFEALQRLDSRVTSGRGDGHAEPSAP